MYDFLSLSPYEFELLVRDLLQAHWNCTLQSFPAGPDAGVDLEAGDAGEEPVIVQCKHYGRSGFRKLLNTITHEEFPKVSELAPACYVLATSVDLNREQKKQLKEALQPWVRGTEDIFGLLDLNNLLGLYPDVEKRHYKLWLTSTTVLTRLLNTEIYQRTDLDLASIAEKTKLYVQNQSYSEAMSLLQNHHFCVIAGVPGIGKTTLAEMLVIEHLAHGYEIITIGDRVGDAFKVLDITKPQLFYFDDFLGQTALREKLRRNEDQDLLRLIDGVRRGQHTRLILTTREYILNQARQVYEKLFRADFDLRRCVIDLSSYTLLNRAQILYNHLYFSALPDELKSQILDRGAYWRIVQHSNYNPRLIEWVIRETQAYESESSGFVERFSMSLENPARIWEHAICHQLSEPARDLLTVLAVLPEEVYESDLQKAWTAYHCGAAASTLAQAATTFRSALKELEGNFVRTFMSNREIVVSFHNPSISDFMQIYVRDNPQCLRELAASNQFFEFCEWINARQSAFRRRGEDDLDAVLHSQSDVLVTAVILCVSLPTAKLSRGWTDDKARRYKTSVLLEDRLATAVRVVGRLCRERIHELEPDFQELFTILTDVDAFYDEVRGASLLNLLIALSEVPIANRRWYDKLTEFTKFALLGEGERLEDFQRAIQFKSMFPGAITTDEWKGLQQNFRCYLGYPLSAEIESLPSEDHFYDFLEELEDTARDLRVGFRRAIKKAEMRAEQIFSTEPRAEDVDAEKRMEEEHEMMIEIARMFKTLAP